MSLRDDNYYAFDGKTFVRNVDFDFETIKNIDNIVDVLIYIYS